MFNFQKLREDTPPGGAGTASGPSGPVSGYQASAMEHPLQEVNLAESQQAQASTNPFSSASGRLKDAFNGARSAFAGRTAGEPGTGVPPPATNQAGASYQNQPAQAAQQPPQQFASTDPNDISPYLKHSFRLGTWMSIPIYLHYTFPLICFLATFSMLPYVYGMALAFSIYGPLLFLTILIHEYGHCWAAIKTGSPVHGILFWPLGGLAFIGHSTTLQADLQVAVGGPFMHLPMILFWVLVQLMTLGEVTTSFVGLFWHDFTAAAIGLNIALMLFNLLIPAFPLDGGRILIDVLLLCGLTAPTAARVSIAFSSLVAFFLMTLGLMSGLSGLTMMAIGAWIAYQAWQLYSHLRKGTISQHPLFSLPSRTAVQPPEQQHASSGTTVRNPLGQV